MAITFIKNIISSGYSLSKINDNFAKIEVALQDALSRSGTTPNQMNADLDMNGRNLVNVGSLDAASFSFDGSENFQTLITSAEAAAVTATSAKDAAVVAKNAAEAAASNVTLSNYYLKTEIDAQQAAQNAAIAAITIEIDPWEAQPIGSIVMYDMGEGLSPPPTNKAYRYIDLTAGLTGVGGYNNGVLTSETVSGSAPSIIATAIVSLSGSPLNGQTIRLLNTERRFLRPGSSGTLEESQNLSHDHGGVTVSSGAHTHTTGATVNGGGSTNPTGGSSGYNFSTSGSTNSAGAHTHTISSDGGTEARPRNIGVKLYRRIK